MYIYIYNTYIYMYMCVYVCMYVYTGFHTGFFLGGGGGELCMHPDDPVITALQCETQINIVYPSVTVSDLVCVL